MNVGTSPVPQRIVHSVLFGSTKCRLMFTPWKDIDNKGIPSQESQRYSPCNPGLASTIYDNLTIRWLNMKSVNPGRAREGICESANSLSNPKWIQTPDHGMQKNQQFYFLLMPLDASRHRMCQIIFGSLCFLSSTFYLNYFPPAFYIQTILKRPATHILNLILVSALPCSRDSLGTTVGDVCHSLRTAHIKSR